MLGCEPVDSHKVQNSLDLGWMHLLGVSTPAAFTPGFWAFLQDMGSALAVDFMLIDDT